MRRRAHLNGVRLLPHALGVQVLKQRLQHAVDGADVLWGGGLGGEGGAAS